jgi:hypothetical protein
VADGHYVPSTRSSDESRKPRIAVDAAKEKWKQDSMIETIGNSSKFFFSRVMGATCSLGARGDL